MHTVVSVEKINARKLHLCDAVKLKDQLHLGYFRKKKKKKRSAHSTWTSHTAPNTTQSSLTTVRLFQSGLSSLKLSPCLWQLGRLCFSAFKKEKKNPKHTYSCFLSVSLAPEYLTITVKKQQFVPPALHFTQMASRSYSLSTKCTQCQEKSSKVCRRAAGADEKNRRVQRQRLFNLGCYA